MFNAYYGNDTVYAAGGNDTVYGGEGNDFIFGQDGDDVLFGESWDDYVDGGAGATISMRAATRTPCMAGPTTTRSCPAAPGIYYGDSGNDYIYSGIGTAETLDGGDGTDWLNATTFSGDYLINMIFSTTNYTGESFVNFERDDRRRE